LCQDGLELLVIDRGEATTAMSTFNSIAWFPLCAGLTGLGLVGAWFALRRRGAGSGLRWAAWALLPIAAYLTGAVEMLWRIGTAIADWVGGFVFSPKVWSGVIVALVALLLFVVSGALRRRAPARGERQGAVPSARRPGLAGQGAETAAIDRPPAAKAAARRKDGKSDDDEFAEIEEILRRRGIS
jgi:heme exporter protein D